MTVQEAKDIFGLRPTETAIKSGLEAFRRSYKNILKDTSLSRDMQKIYNINLEAVETLLRGTDGAVEIDAPAPVPKQVTPKSEPKKKTSDREEPSGFVSLFV